MSISQEHVALVSILVLIQYIYFTMRAGLARGRDTVVAPAMTGDRSFECRVRVQLNTLEQMAVCLPAMWLCSSFFRADVAAIMGVVFIVSRFVYASGYLADNPSKRAPGMIATMLANVVLILCALVGATLKLI